MIKVTELNPIYSRISDPYMVKELLSFQKEYWKKLNYGKQRQEYPKYLVDTKGIFLSGFLPKIFSYLKEIGEEYFFEGLDYDLSIEPEPSLSGITFREDQLLQIKSALQSKRGVLLAPTGVGKTILISGLISCFPTHRILFLVHTIDLVNQTIEEFKRFGFDSISKVGDGEKDCSGRIVVSSIQSFSKLNIEDYCDKFDVVLVDEAHHCSGFPEKRKPSGGLYYRVLSNLLAPMRFALTATLPTDQETKLCLEGLIGNVVSELSFEDATDMKILAAPKIQLIKIDPFVNDDARTYADIYDKAIVENKIRNRLILRTIRQLNKQGLSTVTYVQRTKHISNLMEMAKETKTELHNVQGSTEADLRMELKNDLHHKKIMNVVATSVWTEGLNIPSLNAIILGGGGRDQKELIQKIGRGSRKHTDKNSFVVCDFIDSAKYLSQHFCERLGVYIERGWTINEKRIKDVGRTKT